MNLQHLETLLAAADTGSFAAAADRVGVTQSAVSMQMKSLEEALGVSLFDRSRRPLALSEAGLALLPKARELVRLADELRAQAAGASLAGRLRLGVIPTAATGLVPDVLARLTARAPELQIRLESGLSGELTRRVVSGMLDAALVTEAAALPRGLVSHPVLEEALVVVAPAGTSGEAVALLRAHPFIRFNRRAGVGRLIDAALRRRRIHVRETMELDSIEAILAMVAHGLGVAVVPSGPLTGAIAERVTAASFADPPLTRRVVLVEREATSHMTAALLEELRRSAA